MAVIPYVSSMGRGANRDRIVAAGWRFLISPVDMRDPTPARHCLDNGEWPAFINDRDWDEAAFERALERFGSTADFVVLPDMVAGGLQSLHLSMRWMNRCRSYCNLVLIAVQDGMEPADLAPFVGANVGIFLGGSTEWKLARMRQWGEFCAKVPCDHPLSTAADPIRGCWYHVARVNTIRRFRMAHASGATSIDGSSVAKFGITLPKLDAARRQPDLLTPQRLNGGDE